jgi:hypothetical protein
MWLRLLLRSARSSLCVLAIAASGAAAQTELPKRWFLHDDQAPTLTLASYNPATGDVDISVTCTKGYTDTILALYPQSGEATDGRHMTITLPETTSPIRSTLRATLSTADMSLTARPSCSPN